MFKMEPNYINAYKDLLKNVSPELRTRMERGNITHNIILAIARTVFIEKNSDGVISISKYKTLHKNIDPSKEQIALIREICSQRIGNATALSEDRIESHEKFLAGYKNYFAMISRISPNVLNVTLDAIIDLIKNKKEIPPYLTEGIETLDLTNRILDVNIFDDIIGYLKNLKSLKLPSYADKEWLEVISKKCPNLTELDIAPSEFANETTKTIIEFVKNKVPHHLTKITTLDLSNQTLDLDTFGDLLEQFENLKSLKLPEDSEPDWFEKISKKCPALTSLNIPWGDYDVDYISDLALLTNLRSLTLVCAGIDDISSLAALKNLESLELRSNKKIDNISCLGCLTSLRSLVLVCDDLSDISSLAALTNLESLKIRLHNTSLTSFTDISCLEALTKLTSLCIDSCNFNDISSLEALTNLTSLDLRGSVNLLDISSLKALTNLTSLNISCCGGHCDEDGTLIEIDDLNCLKSLTNLTNLDLSQLHADDLSCLKVLPNLTYLKLTNYQNKDAILDLNLPDENGLTFIHLMCRDGKKQILEELLYYLKEQINLTDNNGRIPLRIAVENNRTDILTLLIQHGALIHWDDGDEVSPLGWLENQIKSGIRTEQDSAYQYLAGQYLSNACVNNDASKIARFKNNSEILNKNYGGTGTLLNYAIATGKIQFAEALIDAGADINQRSNVLGLESIITDAAPLEYALMCRQHTLVEILIRKGADVNQTREGKTLLHVACEKGNLDSLKLLLSSNQLDKNMLDGNKHPPIWYAVNGGHTEVVQELLKSGGVDISGIYENGNTLLHLACLKGNHKIAELLINYGIDIDIANIQGMTAVGILFRNTNITQSLLDLIISKKGIDAKYEGGRTLLHMSTRHPQWLQYFVSKDASLNARDMNGNTTLILVASDLRYTIIRTAELENQIRIQQQQMEELQTKINDPSFVQEKQTLEERLTALTAMHQNNLKHFEIGRKALISTSNSLMFFLKNNADPKIPNLDNCTPLSSLLSINSQTMRSPTIRRVIFTIIDSHIEKGSDVNTKDNTINRETLLMKLAHIGDYANMQKYIEKNNADVYLQDAYGQSVIPILIGKKYKEMINFFNTFKIDIEKVKPESRGYSPLHIAVLTGDVRLTEYIVEKSKRSIFEKDICENTPLNFAIQYYRNSKTQESRENYRSIISTILGKYIDGEELLTRILNDTSIEDIPDYIDMFSNLKDDVNPLEVAILFNDPEVACKVAKKLGKQKFEYWFEQLPKDVTFGFKEILKYDLCKSHFDHKVAVIPEIPVEEEYQMNALLKIFKEISSDQKSEIEFRKCLLPSDKTRSLDELYKSLNDFITNCMGRKHINGIQPGDEEAFWKRIEKAVTNTIKDVINCDPEKVFEKKANLLGEYFGIIGYCATKLDVEFEKIYHLNSGVVRSFQDKIYFLLSQRRARIVESMIPRNQQSIHFLQSVLRQLSEFNIPIQSNPDLHGQDLIIPNVDANFIIKYQNGLFEEVKNYLVTKEIKDDYFQWAKDNGLIVSDPSQLEKVKEAFDYIEKNIQQDKTLPNNAPLLSKHLYDVIVRICGGLDNVYIEEIQKMDDVIRRNLSGAFLTEASWMTNEFEKIIANENVVLSDLDLDLQQAIEDAKMDISDLKNQKTSKEVKNKLLDAYKRRHFPELIEEIKDEDVYSLLQKLEIFMKSQDAPEWL